MCLSLFVFLDTAVALQRKHVRDICRPGNVMTESASLLAGFVMALLTAWMDQMRLIVVGIILFFRFAILLWKTLSGTPKVAQELFNIASCSV